MARRGKLTKFPTKDVEERPIRYRKYRYLFLIVCEDEKTEPSYFGQFQKQIPEDSIFLKTIGTGRDAKGVIEKTLEEREILQTQAKREVDVTWAVFDVDDANTNTAKALRFQDAFTLGKENKIEIAYSNEVFELWLLLHIISLDSQKPLSRAEIYTLLQDNIRKISAFSNFDYQHGKSDILEIVNIIGNQEDAINRADLLIQHHGNREPLNANPSTTVYLLVKDLKSWIHFYSYEPK